MPDDHSLVHQSKCQTESKTSRAGILTTSKQENTFENKHLAGKKEFSTTVKHATITIASLKTVLAEKDASLLNTQSLLASVQSHLADAQKRQVNLMQLADNKTSDLEQSQLDVARQDELVQTLFERIEELMQGEKELECKLGRASQELDQAKHKLVRANEAAMQNEEATGLLHKEKQQLQNLLEEARRFNANAVEAKQEEIEVIHKELEKAKTGLSEANEIARQLKETTCSLREEKRQLKNHLEDERRSNTNAMEATRKEFEDKFDQELMELLDGVAEDEAKPAKTERLRREEAEMKIYKLEMELAQVKETRDKLEMELTEQNQKGDDNLDGADSTGLERAGKEPVKIQSRAALTEEAASGAGPGLNGELTETTVNQRSRVLEKAEKFYIQTVLNYSNRFGEDPDTFTVNGLCQRLLNKHNKDAFLQSLDRRLLHNPEFDEYAEGIIMLDLGFDNKNVDTTHPPARECVRDVWKETKERMRFDLRRTLDEKSNQKTPTA